MKGFTDKQQEQIDLQERFKTCKENFSIFLYFIGYSLNQFVSQLPDENLRKELIKHYEKEVLPTLEGNAAKKIKEFINDYQNDGWAMVNPIDCGPLEQEQEDDIDMSEYEIVQNEEPRTKILCAGITAKNQEGQTLFDLTGGFRD